MKRILLTLASFFLAYQSFALLREPEHLYFESLPGNFLLAWVLNMLVTGIFAFLVFAWPASKLLPAQYYHITNPDGLEKIFQKIGGEVFRKFLLLTFWRNKKQQKRYFNGVKSGLQELDFQSRQSEFGHLIPFVILLIVSTLLLLKNLYVLSAAVLFFNICGNFYPIMLQRHHRMRIALLQQKFKRVGD